jgi:hypothetical protein
VRADGVAVTLPAPGHRLGLGQRMGGLTVERLVVLTDDLDRCLPDTAIDTGHRMTVEGPFDGDAAAQLLRVLVRP